MGFAEGIGGPAVKLTCLDKKKYINIHNRIVFYTLKPYISPEVYHDGPRP